MNRTAPDVVDDRLTSWLTGVPIGQPRPPLPVRTAIDASWVRLWLGPFLLITTTPVLVIAFWMACAHFEGSLTSFAWAGPAAWWPWVPGPTWTAAGIVLGWSVFQLVLLQLLPGPRFLGPVTPAGVQPAYRLNGLAAWGISHAAIVGAWWGGLYRAETVYAEWGNVLITLTLAAFAFCGFLYWKGHRYPSSPDTTWTGHTLFDFFQGIELHPRLFGVNLKQWINCRISMMGWSAAFVVFALAQLERHGAISTAMWASTGVLVVYLLKFFWWESGYFTSLDIMHDRFGYYICWGVLVWVPGVYCLVSLWLVDHPIDWHPLVALGMFALGVVAIWINYQADAQRQRVRATNGQTTVWGRAPEVIEATYTTADGQERQSLLLVSGWWGVARHFHYVPELLLAAAWTLPAGVTHFLPWFYWVFLFILLMDRAVRDEKRCAAKYGPFWAQYTQRVPWRVLPGVF